jgi:tight adherence protein C
MSYEVLGQFAVFVAVTVMLWAMFTVFTGDKSRATERLDQLREPGAKSADLGGNDPNSMTMLEKAAPKLSKAFEPKTELEQNDLKVRLANAGFNSPNAPQMYSGARAGLGLICALAGGALGYFRWGFNMQGMMALAITAAIGLYAPAIWLWMVRRGRMERIFLSLPDLLDLLVVCVEAGLGLDAAMRRVADELSDSAPDASYEFAMCNMQLQMGIPKKQVLHDLGIRSGVDDMRALAAILIQAEKFGSSIAQALRVQSDTMRIKRRQMAEEQAQKTSVKMIFPLVIFIFPGVFVVIVGPAAIMMINNLLTD